MTYMRDFRAELEKRLEELEIIFRDGEVDACDTARASFIQFVCDKTLESYRNGQQAGTPAHTGEVRTAPRFTRSSARKTARA